MPGRAKRRFPSQNPPGDQETALSRNDAVKLAVRSKTAALKGGTRPPDGLACAAHEKTRPEAAFDLFQPHERASGREPGEREPEVEPERDREEGEGRRPEHDLHGHQRLATVDPGDDD